MKKLKMKKSILAVALCLALVVQGCSLAWVSKLDTIIVALAPALINALNIVAIYEGKPANTALEAKITADAASLKTIATDLTNASAATAPTACAQAQAAVETLTSDASAVLQIIQVSSAATTTNAMAVFQAGYAIVETVVSLIPSCASPTTAAARAQVKLATLDANSLVSNYNAKLATVTGYPLVDAYNKSHKLHAHSWAARTLSFGHQK
jgi:uncharacterized protein with PIN domain